MRILHVVAFAVMMLLVAAAGRAAEEFHVIPFNVDPPILIDGDLNDWAGVPNAITLRDREHMTVGAAQWTGPEDLSGVIRLAWRAEGLYVAAEVTDDVVAQRETGGALWKGDHVVVTMDLFPGADPKRTALGAGQFKVGLSPGSLGVTVGNAVLPPEIYVWVPADAPPQGGEIAAARTPNGYLIEAFVPWSRLKVSGVVMNRDANFDVALSDCDGVESRQEGWMKLSLAPGKQARALLLPVVFGDGNGKGAPPVRGIALAETAQIPPGETFSLTFATPEIPPEKDALVFFAARVDRPRVAGFASRRLWLDVNGTRVTGDRIANRPPTSVFKSGKEATFIAPDGTMTLPYAPSAEAFEAHPTYALINGVKGCEFEFNVSGLVKTGENTLTFHNMPPGKGDADRTAALERIEFRIRPRPEKAAQLRPAPDGELPVCEPQTAFPRTYADLAQAEARITFTVNGEPAAAVSSFTAPDGKEYAGSSPFYTHRREVVPHDEWIEVRDTFTNLTQDTVPIIQSHTCSFGEGRAQDAWISGIRVPTGTGRMAEPQNPSVFVATAQSGVGLVILNDAFRIHGEQSVAEGAIRISDPHFVLKGGGEYTAEWAIVPVARPDPWAFINAARRMMDANFPLKILSAFVGRAAPFTDWTDAMLRNFIECKSANVIGVGLYCDTYKGRTPHGLAFEELLKDPKNVAYYTATRDRIRALYPDGSVKVAIYYHCFIDVMDETAETYKECRRLDAQGNQITYGGRATSRLYVPTLDNAYGKAVAKGIDLRLDTLGADGIYWDEYNQSRGAYTYTPGLWDGCSGDIDPKTFQLVRLKAAVHLVSLPFLEYHIKRILDRGPAFFNGAPYSRTLARLKFQAFTETGSISNCHRVLLHSPVALGDHLTERSQKDCYSVMLRALDWGCLYAWYPATVIPTHKTLTEHMFPATPIELHEGYLIAKERIVTNRSGLFGWGDASDFAVYVYDRDGKATDGKEAKKVTRDGKTCAELRIPEGYSAAIVRAVP